MRQAILSLAIAVVTAIHPEWPIPRSLWHEDRACSWKSDIMYISTLSKIIEAMGGELQIIASMPNGRVQIRQFTKIRKGELESTSNKSRTEVR